ncbi:hypothetical protein DPMN_134675 [Dreissena polymorpha]|uniref:C2H2-type domain-containing protein n=1 Tax=Dreissena polymorpha TaxID=45954 RepID=A0A9D4FXR8_DREPO|nr:hypothetical protein DPMN_134675 [Dreissena polymorpha]
MQALGYITAVTGDEQLLSRDRKSQRRLQKQIVILYIKPFPCEQCGKKFSTKDDLNRHVRREVAAKQFTCSICNATLREKIDLQAHLATHNGEKNFACDMCEKRYRHRSSLSKHRSAKHRA